MTKSNITAETIKELRNSTGAGIMDCKRALQEADGNLKKAADVLQKQGFAKAEKRSQREVKTAWSTYIYIPVVVSAPWSR
jgi:translation elongation factor EF-Ts